MAKLAEVVFQGKSGQKYSFNVYPITEECPAEAGIYIFSKAVPNKDNPALNSHTIIYIGMAKSFESRFYNHHKDDCIDKNGANRICLMQVKDENKRAAIEKDLLGHYNTKCNEVLNPVTPK